MRATVRVRMATDKGVAAGLAWDDMSDGVCQAATLSVAIRGQQNFRQAGHGIGFGVISATPLFAGDLINSWGEAHGLARVECCGRCARSRCAA